VSDHYYRRERRGCGLRALIALLVVVVLLVVIDRVAVAVAERQIADRVQTSQGLDEKPSVDIRGFPFLTQVIRGRYREVSATAHGLDEDGLRLSQVTVVADGVRVDLGDLINRTVRSVPVDSARGQVLLDYDDLNAYLATRVEVPKVTVRRSGSDLRVTGTVQIPILNRSLSLSGNAKVDIAGDQITLLPTAVNALTGFVPEFAQGSAREALTVRFTLRNLPFGVRLDSARLTDSGILFTASASGLTLDTSSVG
jgi:hypothetical protein